MFKSHEREIILALFQANDWFDLYALHKKFLLSPAQIVATMTQLKGDGLCETDRTMARLNQNGFIWVMRNRRELFLRRDRRWAVSPLVEKQKIEVGEPYMPRLRSIDKNFFRKLD